MHVTIGVYLSNARDYRRMYVQCLSLSAYICLMPVTIGVYLSNACQYRRVFVQCLSLSAYIRPMLVQNHQTRYNSKFVSMTWNSSPDLTDLPEVSHLLRFGTSSTRAGGQDDVSCNQLPQILIQPSLNLSGIIVASVSLLAISVASASHWCLISVAFVLH